MKKSVMLMSAMLTLSVSMTGLPGVYASEVPVQVNGQTLEISQAPETTVPETMAPETMAPETTVPQTTVPETSAPEMTVPETTVPASETTVPETTVPETTAPETTAQKVTVPQAMEGVQDQQTQTEVQSEVPDDGFDYGTFGVGGEDELIGNFVTRLYELTLGREPDQEGFLAWCNQLKNGGQTGADLVYGFLWSDEFKDNQLSDDEYITVLYRTILGREPDAEGKSDWIGVIEEGFGRLMVCSQFVQSQEFRGLCEQSGILVGEIPLTTAVDKHPEVARFVMRLYELVLGRPFDVDGRESWTKVLTDKNQTAAHVVKGFVDSPEFTGKNLSSSDYASVLYRTLLDREPDAEGLGEWVALLDQGYPKDYILKGFVESPEFTELCARYGITRGSIDASDRLYQNPAQYYQISNDTPNIGTADYNLSIGHMGLKVAKVIERLGVNGGRYKGMVTACRYTYAVQSAVQSFQRAKGLPQTGVVDLETWLAMGFSQDDWYYMGAYVSPNQITPLSGRSDCIEAMIARAYEYLGTPYVVGASGAPGTGVDCSGLVMQALYAAGMDVSPINPIRHSQPGYEYESASMWASSQFMKVPYSQRQRGDLIFYQNASTGAVIHVAIYLGNNQVIESWCEPNNQVIVSPVITSFHGSIKGVARPFV